MADRSSAETKLNFDPQLRETLNLNDQKSEKPEAPLLNVRGVSKIYKTGGGIGVHALKGVDLKIHKQESIALMGSSGSGKSTLMNILGCLDRPSAGTFYLDGIDVSDLDRNERANLRNQKIGFVFQNFHLLSRTSARENVEMPMLYHPEPLSARQMHAQAMAALERVGLADRADHAPNELSGGQQQRVAIARALVNQPKLLLADEPTGNLDTRTSLDIMALFQALNAEGLTILLVTHEPEICDFMKRTLLLRDGLIAKDETNAQLLDAVRAKETFESENEDTLAEEIAALQAEDEST